MTDPLWLDSVQGISGEHLMFGMMLLKSHEESKTSDSTESEEEML